MKTTYTSVGLQDNRPLVGECRSVKRSLGQGDEVSYRDSDENIVENVCRMQLTKLDGTRQIS